MAFSHENIEKKWQEYWEQNKTFKTEEEEGKPKFYALDMFPYLQARVFMSGTRKDTQQLTFYQE